MSTDEQYEKIVQEFLTKMAAVKAPSSEYRTALRDGIGEIKMALEAGADDDGDEDES